eukprot:COSAG06_NODE_53292_length_301_cov_0.405941_1_plen_56_part_10
MYGQIKTQIALASTALWHFEPDDVQWGGMGTPTTVQNRHGALDFFYSEREVRVAG